MTVNMFVKVFFLGLLYFRGTLIYAEKMDHSSENTTVTSTLSQTIDSLPNDIVNKHDIKHLNDKNVKDTENKTASEVVLQTVIKQSDEIIISGMDNMNTESSQVTGSDKINSTVNLQEDITTSSALNVPFRKDSLISDHNHVIETSSKKTLSTKHQTNKEHLQDQGNAITSTTKGITIPSPSASNYHNISNFSDISQHVGYRKHHKSHENIIYTPHHIPFRHHLQLGAEDLHKPKIQNRSFPMDDEPFGSSLLKGQRYIISVLIPIGVGIVGALVIMVTVYGLRHVAQKHGREFPRVDIEAGRQNIASISSERTDKMLLLDDDEDNEF